MPNPGIHSVRLFLHRRKNLLALYRFIKGKIAYCGFYKQYLFAEKPRIFLMATPVHGNLGDHAIVYAEKLYFNKQKRSIVEVPNDCWRMNANLIEKRVIPDDMIVIDGGGNLGTLWPDEDDKISDIISRFKDNKIIVFPQTIWYDDTADGLARLERNKKIYAGAKNLTIMLRDKASFNFASNCFPEVKLVLTKDIVLTIDNAPKGQAGHRTGVLLCLREDKEKVLPDKVITEITALLNTNGIPFANTTTVINKRVTSKTRNRELHKKWGEFAGSGLVITDRLHGMIFAAITRTPCIALNNKSGKVGGCYELMEEYPDICFLDSADKVTDYILKLYKGRP